MQATREALCNTHTRAEGGKFGSPQGTRKAVRAALTPEQREAKLAARRERERARRAAKTSGQRQAELAARKECERARRVERAKALEQQQCDDPLASMLRTLSRIQSWTVHSLATAVPTLPLKPPRVTPRPLLRMTRFVRRRLWRRRHYSDGNPRHHAFQDPK